jgi:transposase
LGASVAAGESGALVEALLREVQKLAGERDHYKQLAELLKRELDRLNDLQKTPREHVELDQIQLAFEQIAKELLAKLASEPSQPVEGANDGAGSGNAEGKKPKKKRDSHGRNALPEHLPVQTIVFTPAGIATDAEVIDSEVSWRLGFRRGGFHRLKIVRPVYSVPRSCAVDVSVVSATLHDGELLRVPPAPPATSAAPVSVTTCVETPDAEGRAADGSGSPPVVGYVGSDVDAGGEGRRKDEPDSIAAPTSPAADAPLPRETVETVEAPATAPSGHVAAPEEEELRLSGSDATTKLICAELPEEMIPRGLPTSDLLAHLITQKFADKNPFNRQEGIYAREGVHLPRGNMCRWAELAHPSCKRVVDAMCAEALATAPYICTDATGILVQANERCKRGHFWVFVAGREHVFFRYSKTQTHKEPLAFFKGYSGTVVADAPCANVK